MSKGTGMMMTDPAEALAFVRGGKAVFTLVSKRSGVRFTFKVQYNDDSLSFVHLRTGKWDAEGEEPWTYVGVIRDGERFDLTKKSQLLGTSDPIKAITWTMTQLAGGQLPSDQLEFWHEGQCSACGLPLTDPESIKRGFGPTCWAVRKRQ